MNKEKYLADRKVLLDEVQKLIDEGKIEDSQTKMKEVETLDNKWEDTKLANANLNALKGNVNAIDLTNESVRANGSIIDSVSGKEDLAKDDLYASADYRKEFMNHVLKGDPISSKFRNANANTKTTDVGEIIPTTVMEKIIEKMTSYGMILPLVTRTSYKGGLKIPTSTVKPVATWVAEGATSDKQKKTITPFISFGYFKLRCAISSSLEVETMALPVFESTFINNAVEAMTIALEQSIISGNGTTQPKGILGETVEVGQNVDIAKTGDVEYETLIKAESALPQAYENDAVWFMTKKTFMKFIGMVDLQKQPIARVNYGIGGRPERTLLGRNVIINDYMVNLGATITKDEVVAFLFNPKDYILNTNLNMTIKKYEDNETDDMVTKALMLVDGKVVDKNSLVTVTKKFA